MWGHLLLLLLLCPAVLLQGCWESNQACHSPTDLRTNLTSLQHLAWGLEDRRRLEDTVDELLVVRPPGSVGSAIVREALRVRLEGLGWQVETQTFTAVSPLGEKVTMTNLLSCPAPCPPRRLALACHIDSKRLPEGFMGATDSAVPCALLVELATSISSLPRDQEELGLTLLFLDGEEQLHPNTMFGPDGLYGSKEMAARLADTPYWAGQGPWCQTNASTELARFDLLLLLDLIGAPRPTFNNVVVDTETGSCDSLFSEVAAIEEDMGRLCPTCMPGPRFFRPECSHEDTVMDDHTPFLEQGLRRALHLVATPFPEVWHTLQDDRAHLDWEAIHRVAAVLRVFLAEFLHVTL